MPVNRDEASIQLMSVTQESIIGVAQMRSYTVKWDIFSGCGSMEAEVDWNIKYNLAVGPMTFMFFVGDAVMMAGWVDSISISYSKRTRTQRIRGRDWMQVLTDNYVLDPKAYQSAGSSVQALGPDGTFKNVKATRTGLVGDLVSEVWESSRTVSQIRKYSASLAASNVPQMFTVGSGGVLTETFSPELSLMPLEFVWTDTARAAADRMVSVKKLSTTAGQTLFDFFAGVVNPVGVFMYAAPPCAAWSTAPITGESSAQIVFHKVTGPDDDIVSYGLDGKPSDEDPYPVVNDGSAGANVISCEFTQDTAGYYKYIRLLGQSDAEMSIVGGTFTASKNQLVFEKVESDSPYKGYKGVVRFKVASANAVDESVWANTKDSLMAMEILQQNRKLYSLRYTVEGHTPLGGGKPYFINHAARVSDRMIPGMEGADFLVYGVQYDGSKDRGMTTTLELCQPGRFDERITEKAAAGGGGSLEIDAELDRRVLAEYEAAKARGEVQ